MWFISVISPLTAVVMWLILFFILMRKNEKRTDPSWYYVKITSGKTKRLHSASVALKCWKSAAARSPGSHFLMMQQCWRGVGLVGGCEPRLHVKASSTKAQWETWCSCRRELVKWVWLADHQGRSQRFTEVQMSPIREREHSISSDS